MTENNEHLALWGGRFTSGPSPELARLSKSTQFDWRLADDDIAGSRAHARALGRAGLLTADELQRMEDALDTLQRHVDDGSFAPIEDDEDEATALERGLIDIAGDELGGKLRAGRSRNDQIACLIRMWLRRHSRVIAGLLLDLVNALIEQSEKAGRTVMPGRTHMQHAQPVLLAHQLMAHAWPLIRDVQRLIDWDKRINASPYGSGALAGNTLGLDPEAVARELGFSRVTDNSIDGTAARDLVAEFAFVAAMTGVDISRLSEEIIIWNTQEFAFVKLDDGYSTGSSIMPQKKNPWTLEHIKGKASHLEAAWISVINAMKNTPYTHCQDVNGEALHWLWPAMREMEACLEMMTDTVSGLKFNKDRAIQTARGNFCTAAELANTLVRHDHISFRTAHEIVAEVVNRMIAGNLKADETGLAVIAPVFREVVGRETTMTEDDVRSGLDPERIAMAKRVTGGTAPDEVSRQLDSRLRSIDADEAELAHRVQRVAMAKTKLEREVRAAIG